MDLRAPGTLGSGSWCRVSTKTLPLETAAAVTATALTGRQKTGADDRRVGTQQTVPHDCNRCAGAVQVYEELGDEEDSCQLLTCAPVLFYLGYAAHFSCAALSHLCGC